MEFMGWKVEPSIYMDEYFKVNKSLLSRFLKKYPNRSKFEFMEHVVYLIQDQKTIICSPYTYSKITKELYNGHSGTDPIVDKLIHGISKFNMVTK
jgi:hypothetical protein